MDRVKQIWYLSPMRAAKVQASLRIRAVSLEPSLLAHTSSESRGTFRQKARSLAPLNGWACAVKICHDGMLEDTNSLDGAHIMKHMCTLGTSNAVLMQDMSCSELLRNYTDAMQFHFQYRYSAAKSYINFVWENSVHRDTAKHTQKYKRFNISIQMLFNGGNSDKK